MSQPGTFRTLWFRWKSLRLPWRKRWLCGFDLAGNTFWEFRSALNPSRPRRIAQYPSTTHYGDVRLQPAWLQWLRHTRPEPPSLEEQRLDKQRQVELKQLAAAADARWNEKESLLDQPIETEQTVPRLKTMDQERNAVPGRREESQEGVSSMVEGGEEVQEAVAKPKASERINATEQEDPWKNQRGGPSEGWQPQAWSPGRVERR